MEQPDNVDEEETGQEEEPVFQLHHPPHSSTTSAGLAAARFEMAPPPPPEQEAGLSETPPTSQPSETFTPSANLYQQTTAAGLPTSRLQGPYGYRYGQVPGSGVTPRQLSHGIPPMVYMPHMYQHPAGQGREEGAEASYGRLPATSSQEQGPEVLPSLAPPPPIAPHFHPSPMTSYPPWLPSSEHPHSMQSSMQQLPHIGPSPAYRYTSPMYGPRMPFYSPYTRYRLSWPPQMYGHAPQPSFLQGYYGLNASGAAEAGPYHSNSPSGVTGVSMQVQPPSSPPSVPSTSNLQQVLNAQPTSGECPEDCLHCTCTDVHVHMYMYMYMYRCTCTYVHVHVYMCT